MENQTKSHTGLTDAEVIESRSRFGANLLTPPKKAPWWKLFSKIPRPADYHTARGRRAFNRHIHL